MEKPDWTVKKNPDDIRQAELRVQQWLASASEPSSFAEAANAAKMAQRDFMSIMTHRLERPFNDELASRPAGTAAEKTDLCHWAYGQLSAMGLGVQCIRTGIVGSLVCDTPREGAVGRFLMRVATPDGQSTTTISSTRLPLVSLAARPLPKHRERRWERAEAERKLLRDNDLGHDPGMAKG